jgi:hypothetical protein
LGANCPEFLAFSRSSIPKFQVNFLRCLRCRVGLLKWDVTWCNSEWLAVSKPLGHGVYHPRHLRAATGGTRCHCFGWGPWTERQHGPLTGLAARTKQLGWFDLSCFQRLEGFRVWAKLAWILEVHDFPAANLTAWKINWQMVQTRLLSWWWVLYPRSSKSIYISIYPLIYWSTANLLHTFCSPFLSIEICPLSPDTVSLCCLHRYVCTDV